MKQNKIFHSLGPLKNVFIIAAMLLFFQYLPAQATEIPLKELECFNLISLSDGKKSDIAAIVQGKPFYLVFSTAT